MKLNSYINKIKTTSKNNKDDENSINSSIIPKILSKKKHERKNSFNSFFSIKSTNLINRHKKILNEHFRDSKSDNNIDIYSPDCDNIDIKINKKNSDSSSSIKNYINENSWKNEKEYINKHIPLEISKYTSHIKSKIKSNHHHSHSVRSQDEINNCSSEQESFINSTPKSLPAIIHSNSTSKIETHVTTTSTSPILKSTNHIYNSSNGRYTYSSPSLNYLSPIKTPLNKNSSKSISESINEKNFILKTPRKSSLSSLNKQKFIYKVASSPLIKKFKIELEKDSEKKNNRTRSINHPSITSAKNESSSISNTREVQEDKMNINNKNQNKEVENSHSILLGSKKDTLINKNKKIKNIGRIDTYSTTCTNSNCTTFCNSPSYDKFSETKENSTLLSDKEEVIDGSSTATVNKDSTTYSLFVPKTLIGNGGLQNSMQREINNIIDRLDQSTLNECSSIDPHKEDIPTIGNKVLLTYLDKDLAKENNNKEKKDTSSEQANGENQSQTAFQDNSIIELDNSTLEEQKIYISDMDIACLDLSKIKADISQSINENGIISNNSITIAPVTLIPSNYIPDVTNIPISTKSFSEDAKGLDIKTSKTSLNQNDTQSNPVNVEDPIITNNTNNNINVYINNNTNINYDINNKKNNNYNDSYFNEKINHQTLTELLRGNTEDNKKELKKNNNENNQINKNNIIESDNGKKKIYLNERTSSLNCPKNIFKEKNIENLNTIEREKEEQINENENEKREEKSQSLKKIDNKEIKKTISSTNSNETIPNVSDKLIINSFKHQSQPIQASSSYKNHYHHLSEGGNIYQEKIIKRNNDENNLFKDDVESLNNLKTALIFLSKNETDSHKIDNSNKLFDTGSSLFSKRKSSNSIGSSAFNSIGHNKKYLSLPGFFSSSNNNNYNNMNMNNIIMPLTTNDEGKIMYPVDRLDSGRKLRAYYGIDCPIFLGDGSKSKVKNYYGAHMFKESLNNIQNESTDEKKNQKFVKRIASFLHIGNSNNNDTNNNKNNIINDNKNQIDSNKKKYKDDNKECPVEYIPTSTDIKENENNDLLCLYNNKGDVIPSDHFNNITSNNDKIIIPVKNAKTAKEFYSNEVKNVSDLIRIYDKDSELYSSKEFSFKDSFSNTLPYIHNNPSYSKNSSIYTKDETENKTTFSMIPSHLRNVITTPSYKRSFCDTEPYLSSFSFEHSFSEYSSSENSFNISNHQINIQQIMAKTSTTTTTTTTTQHKINNSILNNESKCNPLELDNSFVIQKTPHIEEEINKDSIQFSIDENENNIFNGICRHSTSKNANDDIDSLFLYSSNINDLPEIIMPKQEILHNGECKESLKGNLNILNINDSTSSTHEEMKSSLFKDLYDKSLNKDSMIPYDNNSYSYDSLEQLDDLDYSSYSNLFSNDFYNSKTISEALHKEINDSSDDDYNFYDPPDDLNYNDNYIETRKKKYRLKKPKSKRRKNKNSHKNLNITTMNESSNIIENNKNIQIPSVPLQYKERTSSLNANILKTEPTNMLPDKKNIKTTTTTTTTTTIYKQPNKIHNQIDNKSVTKNEYSIKNTKTKTTIIEEEEDDDDGYSSSMSVTSINTELMISITSQKNNNANIINTQTQPIELLTKVNNKNILLSDADTEKIIKSNNIDHIENLENFEKLKMNEKINDNEYFSAYDEIDKTNEESIDVESDIDVVMNGIHSDYELNLEEDDDEENQSISFIKNHTRNANTIRQSLIIEKKCKRTQRNESNIINNQKKDSELFEKQNISYKNDHSESNHNENNPIHKVSINKSVDVIDYFNKNNKNKGYISQSNLPYPYSQSISSSISSIPVSNKYEKDDNPENFSYSVSSISQSDYYEETDTEYNFMNNKMKIYRHQKAKHETKNNKNIISTNNNGKEEIHFQTEENDNEEYCSTEILRYADYSNDPQYNGETFDIDKIENAAHYHNLLSQFLLELLKNKCSEYFFLFHEMIQFQYKVFQCCEQFTREGQEIFNTYLTNSSTLKIDVNNKLIHKIAYGIKYYDRCCFIPLINMVLKILENKYLKYRVHQSTPMTEESNYRHNIMQEYCKILDQEYSSNINSTKILTGEESPNQIYRNMFIRKKVYDFCLLIFGKEYFNNKKSEGYIFKSKIINFSEKLINPTIK